MSGDLTGSKIPNPFRDQTKFQIDGGRTCVHDIFPEVVWSVENKYVGLITTVVV